MIRRGASRPARGERRGREQVLGAIDFRRFREKDRAALRYQRSAAVPSAGLAEMPVAVGAAALQADDEVLAGWASRHPVDDPAGSPRSRRCLRGPRSCATVVLDGEGSKSSVGDPDSCSRRASDLDRLAAEADEMHRGEIGICGGAPQ